MSVPEFAQVPERNPERYGPRARQNRAKCSQLAADFFKDSVKRARERNSRQSELEHSLRDPRVSQEALWTGAGRQEAKYLRFLRTRNKADDYEVVKLIGKGAFGEVKLVRKKADSKIYALKSLVKTQMIAGDQVARVRAERDILAESDSPWVVKLYTTFQDTKFLYMLMEFLPGGDLMTMLIKYDIFSEDITRFYIAEIIMAIEAVHKLEFIHRDIKPDNILLDRGGHVKLTDFGLSTGFRKLHDSNYYHQLLHGNGDVPSRNSRNFNRYSVNIDQISLTVSNRAQINEWRKSRRLMAYSAVGTPDYIAPEILTGQGYSFDCDWWSLGTIMFECLVGWPPFCAEVRQDVYRKIVNWQQCLYFPGDVHISRSSEHLIRSLICNSEFRLGRAGADEIKNHPFFAGVNFDTLRRFRAPFEPRLTSDIDTAYFPTEDLEQQAASAMDVDDPSAGALQASPEQQETPEMTLPFIGYTFKRFENNFR
ncbi:serine/threonine-protein kinase cot-1 [Cryphonectria parasitica EP155]|uniref:non-specific serine/threonine protein kinase n=1 Tax=Cryphonectria parasitica (strain ATCC 38755 / EP155) TaxID=660469 RepID=A0A9P4YD06_CRYP1|nr:serine/threonine-protein kinase cot-1 [Cryphonectria parasitica EP155]KAF3771232.1 serine/threonine-protein kinase cot-1 [Cryphonectria parasitica EP155]